ncbi:MAG: hypothetical protein VB071_02645 [Lawsonibacter sp.]|nr:hypothetical protein [Lawsonibacter sp.]
MRIKFDSLISHDITHVEADELFNSWYPKRWGSGMTVTLKNGAERVYQIDDMSGSVSDPLISATPTTSSTGS